MFQDRERLPFGSMHLGLLLSFGWSCWGTSVSWNLDGRCFHSGIHLIMFDPCNVKAVDFHAKIFVSLSFVRFSRSRS